MIEAIHQRYSCRTYDGRPVEREVLNKLKGFTQSLDLPPFGNRVRFDFIDFEEMNSSELKKLTTYGIVKGARQFIVGAVETGPLAMEDFGYSLEALILQATSLGLGTCILGGTFRRSGFADKMNLVRRETLPAISPLGYPRDKRSMVDRMFRTIAGSDKRKPWNELFFRNDLNTPLDENSAGKFQPVLECVRLAPSASNKQPWRIIQRETGDRLDVYIRRTTGYDRIAKDVRLQNVDIGIALCHFELAARECGLKGNWIVKNPGEEPSGLEYITSWTS